MRGGKGKAIKTGRSVKAIAKKHAMTAEAKLNISHKGIEINAWEEADMKWPWNTVLIRGYQDPRGMFSP